MRKIHILEPGGKAHRVLGRLSEGIVGTAEIIQCVSPNEPRKKARKTYFVVRRMVELGCAQATPGGYEITEAGVSALRLLRLGSAVEMMASDWIF